MLAGVDTVSHCSPDQEGRAAVARYVLQIAAGTTGKIKLLPASVDSVATAGGLTLDQFPEVTINGGSDAPYAPVLETAQQTRVGGEVELASTGAYLGNVRSVAVLDVTAAGGAAFQVLTQSDTRLTARADAPSALPTGFVTVTDANGLTTAIAAAAVPLASVSIPTDHFLVRFRPGAVEPPQGLTAGQTAVFQYASTAFQESLMTTGITELERALPWFEHSDVHSTNLLGEPVELDLADLYVAHVQAGSDIGAIVGQVSTWPEVYYASPDMPLFPATTLPNDWYFPQQWGLWNTAQDLCGFTGISAFNTRVADVWDHTRGDPRERIAILDTGIDPSSDFGGRVVLDTSFTHSGTAYDEDPNRHGTAVAGIAMASGDNSTGIAGVAWNGAPWAIRVFDCQSGVYPPCSGYDLGIIRAVDRCRLKQIPIVNMSFSSRVGVAATDSVWALNDVCLNAFLSGILLVAASGNVVDDPGVETPGVAYPAAFGKRVYAVGAMLPDGSRWEDKNITPPYCSNPFLPAELKCQSSNYGQWMDVIAPGGRLIVTNNYTLESCEPNNPYAMAFGGTSAAAPFVSGVASLLRASVPGRELVGEDIEQVINRTAYNFHYPSGGHSIDVGWGFVRANLARDFLAPPRQVLHRLAFETTVLDSADVIRTFLNVPGLPTNDYTTQCRIYTVRVADPLQFDFADYPAVWARASVTNGWRDVDPFDYREEVPWAEFDGLSGGGPVFHTFVYKIFRINSTEVLGTWPSPLDEVRVAYTAVGTPTTPVGVEDVSSMPELTVTTSPNPTRSPVWVNLSLPSKGSLRAEILDVAGRRQVTLAKGEFEGGSQRLVWNGRREDGTRCLPGIYWCRVEFEGRLATRKFALLGGQ